MMSRLLRNIPVYFLWIAALAICTHQIIPHDHHLVESVNNQEESCPVSKGETGHHKGFPIHCHAFNDLASEKAITFILNCNIQSSDLSFKDFTEDFIVDSKLPPINNPNIREPFSDPYLHKLSQLRAPPSLS